MIFDLLLLGVTKILSVKLPSKLISDGKIRSKSGLSTKILSVTNFLSYGNIDSADALTGYLFDTADVDKFDEPYR